LTVDTVDFRQGFEPGAGGDASERVSALAVKPGLAFGLLVIHHVFSACLSERQAASDTKGDRNKTLHGSTGDEYVNVSSLLDGSVAGIVSRVRIGRDRAGV